MRWDYEALLEIMNSVVFLHLCSAHYYPFIWKLLLWVQEECWYLLGIPLSHIADLSDLRKRLPKAGVAVLSETETLSRWKDKIDDMKIKYV